MSERWNRHSVAEVVRADDPPVEVETVGTTLIVCSRNRPTLLYEVVASILEGDDVPDELLIVDQSIEPHPDLAFLTTPRCAFRYLHSRTVGLSRGRNIGVAAADHPIIVFTDDDALVPPTWFAALIRAFRSAGPRSVVTGRVVAGDAETEGGFAPSLRPGTGRVIYEGRVRQDPLAMLNVALPRSAYTEVGGCDARLGTGTRFPAAEDNDLGHRLLEAGYRIVFVRDAIVYHRAWRDDRAYVPLCHAYGRGQGAFFAKHLSFDDRYILRRTIGTLAHHVRRIPQALLDDLRASAGRASAGPWMGAQRLSTARRQTAGELAWILGFLGGLFEWITTMRRLR